MRGLQSASQGKHLVTPYLKNKLSVMAHTPNPSYSVEEEGSWSNTGGGQKCKTLPEK
jgi:hypothetical protein